MSDNGTQLCIPTGAGGAGYIHRAFHAHRDFDLDFTTNGNPSGHVRDGYFVFTTDAKIHSLRDRDMDYNAIDYGTAESSPDATVNPKTSCSFVETTTEAFSASAVQTSPFSAQVFLDEGHCPFQSSTGPRPLHLSAAARAKPQRLRAKREHHTEDFNRCDRRAIAGPDHGGTRCGVWLVLRTIRPFLCGWTLPTTAIVFDTTTGIWAEWASRYIDENDDTIDITYRAACFVQA